MKARKTDAERKNRKLFGEGSLEKKVEKKDEEKKGDGEIESTLD